MSEPVKFTLGFNNKCSSDNLMLRFVVLDKRGTTVGTAYSEKFSLHSGIDSVSFEFDTTKLAPNDYRVDLILLEYNGETQKRHDLVTQAFGFSVDETEVLYNMEWNLYGWGSIRFNEIKLVGR